MSKQNEFHPIDDRELMVSPGRAFEPVYLIRAFGCFSSLLLVLLSWVTTAAVMVWQSWPLALWPFLAVPAALWVSLLAVPAFVKMRRGLMTTLDAIVKTSEAYLARAGWSVDINSDGFIGHHVPVIQPAIQDVRPIVLNAGDQTRIVRDALPAPVLADEATDHVGGADRLPVPEQPEQPERVKVWHLPNGERCHQSDLEQFVDGVFTLGWSRGVWLQKGMRREVYEGCVALLEQGRVITDRKPGFAGRLNCRTPRQARQVLDLPTT